LPDSVIAREVADLAVMINPYALLAELIE